MTLANLLARLRIQLRDPDDAQWTADDKRDFINTARLRTMTETDCFTSTASVAVASGTATYDVTPVYAPRAVRLGDNVLTRVKPSEIQTLVENWDAVANATPTRWFHRGGTTVWVNPTPNAAAAGIIGTVAGTPTAGGSGYAANEVLSIDEGTGGKVKVLTVSTGAVATLELNPNSADNQGRVTRDRGTGYTTGAGKATTADSGSGTGCTINISALAKIEAYGPSSVDDMTSDSDEITEVSEGRIDAILHAAREEAWLARPTMPGSKDRADFHHAMWEKECQKIKADQEIA